MNSSGVPGVGEIYLSVFRDDYESPPLQIKKPGTGTDLAAIVR
jgi:hypothetical protein